MSLFEVSVFGVGGKRPGPSQQGGEGELGGPPIVGSPLWAALFRVAPARRGAGVWAFVLAIVTAGALAHVGVRLKGLEVAYDLGRERRIATDMEEQRRRLQIEIGMLKDPRRVIALAREKLNMAPPPPEAIWRLGSGRLVPPVTPLRPASSSHSLESARSPAATRAASGQGKLPTGPRVKR